MPFPSGTARSGRDDNGFCKILRQEGLHAEAASAGFFEFGGVDENGGQSLLAKIGLDLRRDVRGDVVIVQDDAVAHELVGLFCIEEVKAFPALVEGGERFGGEGSDENQGGIVVQRTEAGVEVITVWISEFQGQNGNAHLRHGHREFVNSAAGAAKSVAAVNAGTVGMPYEIAVAFQIVIAKLEINDPVVTGAEPLSEIWDFALTGFVDHPAGDDEFPVSGFFADEDLIRGEDHVFETFDRIDDFDIASVLL